MTLSITDEIIDAIIQNQGCHIDRPDRKQRFLSWRPRIHFAVLKPDWVSLPADTIDDPTHSRSGTME